MISVNARGEIVRSGRRAYRRNENSSQPESLLNGIKLLTPYIPIRLFAGSSLPLVNVNIKTENKRNERKRKEEDEDKDVDVTLALSSSGFLPGKPTFRVRYSGGAFVPLDNSNISGDAKQIITGIEYNGTPLYEHEPIKSHDNKIKCKESKECPDEYRYLLEKLNKQNARPYSIIGINVLPFMHEEERRRSCARWLFDIEDKTNFEDSSLKKDLFYTYLDTSNAYPRFSIFIAKSDVQLSEESLCSAGVKGSFSSDVDPVFYGVYAVDINAVLAGKYKRRSSTCIAPINDTRRRRYRIYFVKILAEGKEDEWRPVILGYQIRNTRMLTLDILNMIKSVWLSMWPSVMKAENNAQLDMTYRALSLNTLTINVLRHYLSHDLALVYYMTSLGFTKINKYIDLLLLKSDLFDVNIFAEMITNNNFVSTVIDKIFRFENELNEPWMLILRYMLTTVKGERLEKYREFPKDDPEYRKKMEERLRDILQKYEKFYRNIFPENSDYRWYFGAILDIIIHSYSHHIIRAVSSRWRVSPDKLVEYYHEMNSQKVAILEKDSGGIGVLDEAFKSWQNPDINAETAEDLVISLGKCLVGTPEDLLHFALINDDVRKLLASKTEADVRRGIRTVLERLNILVTSEELEETVMLWRSIYEEAKRLVEIIGGSEEDGLLLLENIHRLRYNLELKIRRFPELDELIAYAIESITDYEILKSLLIALLRGIVENNEEYKKLKELYGNADDYIDQFIHDIQFIIKSRMIKKELATTYTQSEIMKCFTGERKKNDDLCKSIIHMLKLVGRVLRGILMRLSLLSCNGACGMCYVNTKSCSRFSASFIQVRTVDRRVLKIIASEIVKKMGKELNPNDYYRQGKCISPEFELGGKPFTFRCS